MCEPISAIHFPQPKKHKKTNLNFVTAGLSLPTEVILGVLVVFPVVPGKFRAFPRTHGTAANQDWLIRIAVTLARHGRVARAVLEEGGE